MGIAWGEQGAESVWVPVVVRNRPERWDAYDSDVVFEVKLPPGSGSGPLVYKPYLREIGRHSAPGYRATLGLCYLWDRYGSNKGIFKQATIPRLARNDQGELVNSDGEVLLTKTKPTVQSVHDRRGEKAGAYGLVSWHWMIRAIACITLSKQPRIPTRRRSAILYSATLTWSLSAIRQSTKHPAAESDCLEAHEATG